MYRVIAVFCALLGLAKGQTTKVDICQMSVRPGDLPINAYVHGCVNHPCLLPQLQDVFIDVTFRAPRNVSRMTTLAVVGRRSGFILSIIPLNLGDDANTCDFLTLPSSCPIQEDEIVQYRFRMLVEEFLRVGTQVHFEIRVVDDDYYDDLFATIWCIRFPAIITEPLQSVSSTNERDQDQH